jgi:hypothetical protein
MTTQAILGTAYERVSELSGAIWFVLLLFLVSCIFDPADMVVGAKIWLFLIGWVLTVLSLLISPKVRKCLPRILLVYTLLFILIPVVSIVSFYLFSNVAEPFEGFSLLKGYLLISLAPMLVINQTSLLPRLCAILTLLALAIIGTAIALKLIPGFFDDLYQFGKSTGVVLVDIRDYGSGSPWLQVYFVTSPMLVISLAYYFGCAMSATKFRDKASFWALTAISGVGLLLAGTRNNILASFLVPAVLWYYYARRKVAAFLVGITVTTLLAVVFLDDLGTFFDSDEYSNKIKLSMLADYGRILTDERTLIFGQGLGTYCYWEAKNSYFYISELTYLELIRNFGLFGAVIMLGLLLYPIIRAFAARCPREDRTVALSFGVYLLMCFSNPNLFSSMGILLLSTVLGDMFLRDGARMSQSFRGLP